MTRNIIVDNVDFGLLRDQRDALLRIVDACCGLREREFTARDKDLLEGVISLLDYMLDVDEEQN